MNSKKYYYNHLINHLKKGKKVCIIGTGGFGAETLCCLIDILANSEFSSYEKIACFMVTDKVIEGKVMGLDVISLSNFDPEKYVCLVAVSVPEIRKKIVASLPENTQYTTLIHPSVIISDFVEIEEGGIVTGGVIITCNITIGKHVQLNLHTTIGHDSFIGDFFTTAPAVNISGLCTIGNCVYFGTNATIKQGVVLTDNVTIGMGGVVVKSIHESGTYIGVPVKKLVSETV